MAFYSCGFVLLASLFLIPPVTAAYNTVEVQMYICGCTFVYDIGVYEGLLGASQHPYKYMGLQRGINVINKQEFNINLAHSV